MTNKIQQNLPRDFKGIWIPKEIWLHKELCAEEKLLWAEIDSLDGPEGCFASNEYFVNFFGWPERTLRNYLSRLKNLGFIRLENFDGRTRILRSCLKTTQEKFDTSARPTVAGLRGKKQPVSLIGDSIERENKEENKDKNLPLPPSLPESKKEEPPTKEEEEELLRRIRERPKNAPRIVSLKKYKQTLLLDIRSETQEQQKTSETILKRKREAKAWDGKKINGMHVSTSRDYVEFSLGSYAKQVRYDTSEEEWKSLTTKR